MSISRWLRVSVAVAAMAAVDLGAPAAHAAVTPCTDPDGVVAQGYVMNAYVQVRHDRLTLPPNGSGLKLCFHAGGTWDAHGDTYGVADIAVPGAAAAPPQTDEHHARCREHPNNLNLYEGTVADAGITLRIDYLDTPNWRAVCWAVVDAGGNVPFGGRIIVHGSPATVSGGPQVGYISPAPVRDMSKNSGFDHTEPSYYCSAHPMGSEVTNFYSMGNSVRIGYTLVDAFGQVSVCPRHQDASGKGFGGRLTIDTKAVPSITQSTDPTPCTEERTSQSVAGKLYLWIGTSPFQPNGSRSICVKTSPTSTTRLDVTPAVTDVVRWRPDSDSQ
jgi:hypothetical protein